MVPSRCHIRTLLSAQVIHAKVLELGERITRDYAGKELLTVGLLNGAYPFFADLTRAVDLDLEVAFMRASSYGSGTESSGEVKILQDLEVPIQGRHVLLVEDIVDTGLTLQSVLRQLRARHPASLRICSLLDKPSRRKASVDVDYLGFAIEDDFVVGYGLDFDGHYRNLPFVGVCENA